MYFNSVSVYGLVWLVSLVKVNFNGIRVHHHHHLGSAEESREVQSGVKVVEEVIGQVQSFLWSSV